MEDNKTDSKSSENKEFSKTKLKNDNIKKKNKKGKHVKEDIKAFTKNTNGLGSGGKKFNAVIGFFSALIIIFVLACLVYLAFYIFNPESTNELLSIKSVNEYNKYLRELTTSDNILLNGNESTIKFVIKKYKDNSYNVATGYFDREYDIIYFNLKEDVNKVDKLSTNSILSYDKYVEYCKTNNIKQRFIDKSKRYAIFSNFSAGYDDINILVCDRQVEHDTEVMYLSKEYSNSNPEVTSGFVIIFPSSQKNTTKTAMKEVISESDFYKLSGEKIKITNGPINKDVLFIKNKTITDDEKVNIILNKMLDNICHKNTINYTYSYEIPSQKTIGAKLDLNNCIQLVKIDDSKTQTTKYTVYGDYEAVEYDEKGFIGNSWTYKDEIIKKFIQAESLSSQDLFDFKLDEDDDYYIVKAYVARQNYTIEGKVSREEEFFYIDKETFELKKIYCHNYISRYEVLFNYTDESLSIPESVLSAH